MTNKRTAPYRHTDGSGCWTKDCSKNSSSTPLQPHPSPISLDEMMSLSNIAATYVPRNIDAAHFDYYAATDKKHFGDKTQPGSKFLDPSLTKIEDILLLRMRQSGTDNLDGDDRAELIARGSDPNGFRKGNRYLIVLTEGTVGIQASDELSDDYKVQIVRTKPGASCSLVMEVEKQNTTDFAVIILGKHEKTGKDFLITTFPGPSTKPTVNDTLDQMEGQYVTVGEVRRILGEEFWINTKLS